MSENARKNLHLTASFLTLNPNLILNPNRPMKPLRAPLAD